MKKIIFFIGLAFLVTIVVFNIFLTANLGSAERVVFSLNSFFYIIGLALVGLGLFFISNLLNKYLYAENTPFKKHIRKVLLTSVCAIYIAFTILWTLTIKPTVGADQICVGNLAQVFYNSANEHLLSKNTYVNIPISEYIQGYQHQIPLAFLFSLLFKLIHFDNIEFLKVFNIISIFLIVFAIFKISHQLAKKYVTNKVLLCILILTFLPLPMLSTFIYGDFPSLAFCLLCVYFMMKYVETKKLKFCLLASFCSMIGYLARMNALIFVIATTMYLLFDLLNKETFKRTWKENLLKFSMIVIYIAITILPSTMVKNYYLNKYDLDKSKAYPNISYFLMAMEQSYRASGWYNESIGEYALKHPEAAKEEYKITLKERVNYLIGHPLYTAFFYGSKISSMWTENTYSSIWSNNPSLLQSYTKPLIFYQKVLLLMICLCSIVVLMQNRKNLSLEVLFLLTIFIGGFAFHILWEAKSRYIIPYIIVLIPLASIAVKGKFLNFNITKKQKEI